MSGEDLYRGAVALGQGLSGGGIEGMLQRERQKAELENAMAQLRLQAELKQRAEQARWEHEAQIQAALDQEAAGVYGSSGGGWVPSTGPDQTQVINAALSENSGGGPSGMFLPNERLMRYLLKAKPEAAARLAEAERGHALDSGLQDSPVGQGRLRLLREQAETEGSQQYANRQLGDLRGQQTRKAGIEADWANEQERARNAGFWSLSSQRDTAADANAARAKDIEAVSEQKVKLYEGRIANEFKKGVNLDKTGKNIDARTEDILSDIENDAELTEATKKKLQAQTITEGFRAKLVQEDAATERAKQGTEAAKQGKLGAEKKKLQAQTITEGFRAKLVQEDVATERAKQGTEAAKQGKLGAEKKYVEEKTGWEGIFSKAKTATEEARSRVFGSRATSIENKEAREAASFPVKLSQEIEKLAKVHAETAFRQKGALNQESQIELAKAKAERIAKMTDQEMALLKSRGQLTDQQARWYQSRSKEIAFDLANPGIKLTEGMAMKLMGVLTNPKATRSQKDAAMQQLESLLQGFPDLTVQTTPGEEGFMGIGSTPDRLDILHKMRGLEDLSSSNLLRDEEE